MAMTGQRNPPICSAKAKLCGSWPFPQLANGRYSFSAVAQDGAGNLSVASSADFFIQAPAPRIGKRAVLSTLAIGDASVVQQTVSLSFKEMLDTTSALDRANFVAEVNGVGVPIADIVFAGAGNAIALHLNSNTLSPGARVRVLWQELMSSQGQPVPDGEWEGSAR
jgi:hypothetical protein